MVDGLLSWLASLPPGAACAVLMTLSALENVFPPVPADVAVALGAFLAPRLGQSALLLGVLCWLANTLSSVAMYWLGRTKGHTFFASGWPSKLVTPQAMALLAAAYEKHGFFGIFISRFMPGVRAAVTPFAGIVGLSAPRAMIPAALASAIWYALIVSLATTLGLQWAAVRVLLDRISSALGLLGLLALALGALWFVHRLRRR